MKLTLEEISNLNYELNGLTLTKEGVQTVFSKGLLKQKTSMKNKIYFQRLNNVVAEEVKLMEAARKELYEKYGNADEDGSITIPSNDIQEFQKEFESLLKAEKEIDVKNLWATDLTIEDLSSIETDEVYPIFFKLFDK
jgi:hypothetical protein